MTSMEEAAERRAAAAAATGARAARTAPPGAVEKRQAAPVPSQMRSAQVERDGKQYLRLTGMASVYERGYEIWDFYGPYTEIVSEGAGAQSLSAGPNVVFLLNHGGIPFARTGLDGKVGTLDLSEPGGGLLSEAYLNPTRGDAKDLVASVDDGSSTEMSFAFRIDRGQWSPDYTEYRINAYDIDRGDTSVVTYGANPFTSIEARAAQFAITNNVVRAARALDAEQRGLLVDAIGAVPDGATLVERDKLGARAIADLGDLRAQLARGEVADAIARASLVAVLDDLIDGTGLLRAGDGPLQVLLSIPTIEAPAAPASVAESVQPAPKRGMSLGLAERELEAARRIA